MRPGAAARPSGVVRTKVNIHFTRRVSGVLTLPTGSFSSTEFQPFWSLTGMTGRAAKFSLPRGVSLERSVWA